LEAELISRRDVLLVAMALSALVSLPAHGADQSDISLAAVMSALAEIRSSKAAFVEERYVTFLSTPLVLEGTLSYEPHRLEKHVRSPDEERLIIEGDRLSIVTPGKSSQVDVKLSDYPALATFITALRATMGGDLATLERLFEINFSSEANSWQLRLTPKQAEIRDQITTAEFTGLSARITRLDVLERNGDRTVIRLRALP
jgi:outer membrane lipoprotein-sorting protein